MSTLLITLGLVTCLSALRDLWAMWAIYSEEEPAHDPRL